MIPSYEKCWHRDVKEVVEVGEEGLDRDVHVLRFQGLFLLWYAYHELLPYIYSIKD